MRLGKGDDRRASRNLSPSSLTRERRYQPANRGVGQPQAALKATYDDSVWEHLAGTISAPFVPGDRGKVAVKVIDDRGNELMVVREMEG